MPNVLTVSQFVESIRGLLRETLGVVTVQGEVTGYRTARNGTLVYFEIKDDTSRVLCFGLSHEVKTGLTDGMEIRVTGSASLFKGNGGFHLRVIEVELVGEGALRKQFELTKKRLEAEGLFRTERKRPLPAFPEVVGIVTSPDAAAYTDVLRILKNRWPLVSVKLAGVSVQGPGAARQMVRALEHFSISEAVDVIILTRGGGSLEDLQAFNDEIVARAIYASRVPVVVGVGHERDVTIADLVADVRASTPSNAAERVVPDRIEIARQVESLSVRLARATAGGIEHQRSRLAEAMNRLGLTVTIKTQKITLGLQAFSATSRTLAHRTAVLRTELSNSSAALQRALAIRLAAVRERRQNLTQLLRSLSPLAILKRGYSITTSKDGRVLRKSSQTAVGESLHTRYGTGSTASTVTEVS